MSDASRWVELAPDEGMIAALDEADSGGSRSKAVASTSRRPKHRWSNAFADACARMVAAEVARHGAFERLDILPKPGGPAEPVTFPVGGERKKIDVAASQRAHGLQLGISLKGMNFRDRSGLQFDKNLTGRTYELENELRGVHRGLPRAFMVGLYFMPIAATCDKRGPSSASSFARTVQYLRARVGRTDPQLPTQAERADMAAVALYVPGDHEEFEWAGTSGPATFRYEDQLPRGVVRYFDVRQDPPKRGRPKLDTTYDLAGLVNVIAAEYTAFTLGKPIDWADPEAD